MKKSVFSFAVALCLVPMAMAQTFTAVNDDGVSISYSVTSAEEHTVSVAQGEYNGRVVVPQTVNYDGTGWVVTAVGSRAFYGSGVTFVSLPNTVLQIGSGAFTDCEYLDTLVLNRESPIEIRANYVFGSAQSAQSGWGGLDVRPEMVLSVPCGSLQAYRNSEWGRLPWLTSPCAVRLTVLTTEDSIVRVDSVRVRYGNTARTQRSNGYYEVGDTARLVAEVMSEQIYWAYRYYRHGIWLGWSDGLTDMQRPYVVRQADTVWCMVREMPHATLNANRINTPVYIYGTLGYDGNVSHFRFNDVYNIGEEGDTTYPTTLFATGLWVGNHDHMAAGRYMTVGWDWYPGPLKADGTGTTSLAVAEQFCHVWHITREMIDYHIAHVGERGYTMPDDIRTWPGNGPEAEGYAAQLAPYYDANGNGRYDPERGDYPLIRGDEATFSIFNDGYGVHTESNGEPLGIEVHVMTYAFGPGNEVEDSSLRSTVFVHYDVYNRAATDHDSTYFGAWSDFDIGYSYDDRIGCDVRRGMYYGYNGDTTDRAINGVPPAQGCIILGGPTMAADGMDNPKVDIDYILNSGNGALTALLERYHLGDGLYDTAAITADADSFYAVDYRSWYFHPGDTAGNYALNGAGFGNGVLDDERYGMTSFVYYDNSSHSLNGEPSKGSDYYNLMHSRWKNGHHVTYGGTGIYNSNSDCRFMFPGESDPWMWGTDGATPDDPTPWTDEAAYEVPGDRRGVAGSGPFTFAAGSVQQFDVAYTTGPSVAALPQYADAVRRQWVRDTTDYDNAFTYSPYSEPLAIRDVRGAESALAVYPNPTKGQITIKGMSAGAKVEVMDMMGHRLHTAQAHAGSMSIDMSGYAAGVYLVRVGAEVYKVLKR